MLNSCFYFFFFLFQAWWRVVAPFPWHQCPITLCSLANGFPPSGHAHCAPDGMCSLPGCSSRGPPEEEVLLWGLPRPVCHATWPLRQQGQRPTHDKLWPRAVIALKDPAAVCGPSAAQRSGTLERAERCFFSMKSLRMPMSRWAKSTKWLKTPPTTHCCPDWLVWSECLNEVKMRGNPLLPIDFSRKTVQNFRLFPDFSLKWISGNLLTSNERLFKWG